MFFHVNLKSFILWIEMLLLIIHDRDVVRRTDEI